MIGYKRFSSYAYDAGHSSYFRLFFGLVTVTFISLLSIAQWHQRTNPDDGLDDPHQAHIEALLGQREVSQLQLWLCKAKKVNRGKIWQVADSLDHFAAI
jgi:hypothetical protein